MKLFNKKIGHNSIVRLYKSTDQKGAEQFDTKSFIDFLLGMFKELNTHAEHFYITGPYPSNGWRTEKGFLRGVNAKHYRNIHHLLISDKENLISTSFTNWAHNFTVPIDFDTMNFDLMIDEKTAVKEYLVKLVNEIYTNFSFDYGFILDQPKNYSMQEGKIVNRLFMVSERENKAYKKWSRYQDSIKDGYIRNLYEYNFLSKRQLENELVHDLIFVKGIGRLATSDKVNFWSLTRDELVLAKEIAKSSRWIVENAEFDLSDSKTEIDGTRWNRIRPTTNSVE